MITYNTAWNNVGITCPADVHNTQSSCMCDEEVDFDIIGLRQKL